MGKYLKKFSTHTEYQTYITSEDFAIPNVSICVDENDVHFNPNNYILYEASAKLPETTSQKNAGLHTNAFNTTIASHTFENGEGLIVFNEDVTSIGNYAFYSCSGLTNVTIGNSVTSIGEYAFNSCSGLTNVTIGSSVTSIGYNAFNSCSGLTSITIPNSVTIIGEYAFNGCSGLTNVTIGNSVTGIGNYAFLGCTGLTSISVGSGNTVYDSRGNCNAIIKTSTNTLLKGCNNTVIPNTVTSIGSGAFIRCSGLTSITIPNGVTSIGADAFNGCTGLTSFTIPDSVTRIENGAFQACSGLTSITCSAMSAPAIYSYTFQSIKTGGTLYVPTGSTGYDVWMGTGNYYLGKYNWTIVEQ